MMLMISIDRQYISTRAHLTSTPELLLLAACAAVVIMTLPSLPSIPIRWQVMILLCFSTLIIFTLRINMSVIALTIASELQWNEIELGHVYSSLYYGYALGQIPSNLLSQKYGGKYVLGVSIMVSCFLNLFIPIASKTSISSIITLQIFCGLFQAGCFPACYYLYPRWMPLKERTLMVSFVVTGVYMGEIIGLGLSGYLVNAPDVYVNNFQIGSWDSSFYIPSLFGVIWFPFYFYFIFDSPAEHPRITDDEYEYIRQGSGFVDSSEHDLEKSNQEITLPFSTEKDSPHSSDSSTSPTYAAVRTQTDNESTPQIDVTVINPLYISSQNESNTSFTKDLIPPWIHDLRKHPEWRRDLPPGRLHHHYHRHHSHKLELHKVPWGKIFTHSASLALLINTFAQGWIGLMILTEMPAFLHQQLGCDISHSGYLSILPYFCNLVSVELFSLGFNWCMVKGWMTRWQVRQWANRIGLLLPSLCLVIVGHVSDPGAGVILLCLTLFFFGAVQSGTPVGFMDIAPNFSSEMNTIAIVFLSCAGFLTPMTVAYFQNNYSLTYSWQCVFYLTLCLSSFAIIIWRIFGRSEIIPELNNRILDPPHGFQLLKRLRN